MVAERFTNVGAGRRHRRRWIGIIAPILLLHPLSVDVAAALGDDDESTDAGLRPVHTISFRDSPRIGRCVFSVDSKSLFVELHPQAVNVWALLVYRWPEILGALAGLATLCLMLFLWRILRRRQFVGRPHCRKCNYCLEGCPSERCPECGYEHALPRAIVGRPTRRRVLPTVVALVLVASGYATLHIARVPRSGTANDWINWWSVDLLKWAREKGQTAITDKATAVTRIVELDVATGKILRAPVTRAGDFELSALSPGGEVMLLRQRYKPVELLMVDTTSGQLMRTFSHPDVDSRGVGSVKGLAGFSDDGQNVYVVWLDRQRSETQLIRWCLKTGEAVVVLKTDTVVQHLRRGGDMVWPRPLHCVPGSAGWVLELPHPFPGRGGTDDRNEILVRDLGRGGEVVQRIPYSEFSLRTPVFSADTLRMFMRGPRCPGGICGWDLRTAEELPGFGSLPEGYYSVGGLAYDQQHERLFSSFHCRHLPEHSRMILAADTRKRVWIGRFLYSDTREPCGPHRLRLSPDGRTLATACSWQGNQTRKPSGQELLLWDLSILDVQ